MLDELRSRVERRGVSSAWEQNHQRLLKCLEDLLNEGFLFADVSIDMVSKRAGFARTTVYRHFPTMRDMGRELVLEHSSVLFLVTEPRPGEPAVAFLDRGIRAVLQMWREHGAVWMTACDLAAADRDFAKDWINILSAWAPILYYVFIEDNPELGRQPPAEVEAAIKRLLVGGAYNFYASYKTGLVGSIEDVAGELMQTAIARFGLRADRRSAEDPPRESGRAS
ncbi:hypothetical protein GCM10027294_22780 [Marinactinospora endophytica]